MAKLPTRRPTSPNINPKAVAKKLQKSTKVITGLPPLTIMRATEQVSKQAKDQKNSSVARSRLVSVVKRFSGSTGTGVATLRFVTKSKYPTTAHIPPQHDTIVKLVGPGRVWVHCGCLPGTTRVLTDKGWQTMYELVNPDEDPRRDFTVNYKINGDLWKGSAPFYKGIKPVWKVDCDNGYHLIGTKDHEVLVYHDKYQHVNHVQATRIKEKLKGFETDFSWNVRRLKWVEIKDLKVGDRIMVNHDPKLTPKPVKDRHYWESYFVGAFLGDGTLNPLSIEIHSHPRMIKLIKKAGVGLTLAPKSGPGRYLINHRGREILAKYGITKDRMYIPINDADIFGLVSGLIDSDGRPSHICGSDYLYQLADKMIELGWPKVKMRRYRSIGVKTNVGTSKRNLFYLSWSSTFTKQHLNNFGSLKLKDAVWREGNNEISNWAKVETKTYVGRQHVYDIHVPGTNRFIAEGFVVHNCESFVYSWEYALAQYGASSIINGNGEPAVMRNPTNIPGACLHLYKVLGLPSTMKRLVEVQESADRKSGKIK